MKVSLVLTLSYLITAVWAGGYQGCLERVWIFQSYLIDQHNPERDRQIGYQCTNFRKPPVNRCLGTWIPCRGRQGRAQCNFDDFQQFLGNTMPGMPLQAAYGPDGSLDARQTAVNCLWAWRSFNRSPRNFKGHKAVKYGRESFNDFILRIGQINNDHYNNPAVRGAAGNAAFSQADDTLTKITRARVADHGRHLIREAQEHLPGVAIHSKDMGASPLYRTDYVPSPESPIEPDTPRWSTVDWEATINNSPDPANTRTQVRNWLNTFYRGSPNDPPPSRRGISVLGSTGRCSGRTKQSKTEQTVAGGGDQPTTF